MKIWFKYLTLTEKLLVLFLIISHLFFYFFLLKETPFFGDENYYSESSSTIATIFANSSNPHVQSMLTKRLVGNGYFMPFYSFYLTPLSILEFSSATVRLFFLLLNVLLSLVLIIEYKKIFGSQFSILFIATLGLMPTLLLYNQTITPEAIVAKLLLLATLIYYKCCKSDITPARLLIFTFLLMNIILFRQSTAFIIVAFILWYCIEKGLGPSIFSSIKKLTTILLPSILIICLALFFWSNLLNDKYGPGYLTTTSTDLSFMVLWGDGFDKLGNMKHPSVWKRLNKHYIQTSRAKGITFKEAVMIDKNKVWNELTIRKYLKGLKRNIKAFVAPRSSKIKYMFEKSKQRHRIEFILCLRLLNAIVCYLVLSSICILLLFPKLIQINHRKLLSILLLCVPFLMVHIFVARANGRHGMIMWWVLTVISSVVFSNAINYIKAKNNSTNYPKPMSNSYSFSINVCRIFTASLLVVLLFF